MNDFTKFERLLLAVAIRELTDRHGHIRGLIRNAESLGEKLNIDADLWAHADRWLAEVRGNPPAEIALPSPPAAEAGR